MNDWAIRAPASSANVGPGFDVLGMALTLHAELGCGEPPDDTARPADEHHPATIAFHRLGGEGPLWVRSPIPMGRGLGFSGAMRVGGAMAAVVQHHGPDAASDTEQRARVLDLATELEHHADNAAATLHGGLVVATDVGVTPVPLAIDPAVVVWIPDAATTSTDRSRRTLPATVELADAVFNIGRVATLVAACASGDVRALRSATDDRLHQPVRLAAAPDSAAALDAGLAAGAWAGWLSGSGPTVALWCDAAAADELAGALPAGGHAKILRIDHAGTVVVD